LRDICRSISFTTILSGTRFCLGSPTIHTSENYKGCVHEKIFKRSLENNLGYIKIDKLYMHTSWFDDIIQQRYIQIHRDNSQKPTTSVLNIQTKTLGKPRFLKKKKYNYFPIPK
jgi:hypothetical protein